MKNTVSPSYFWNKLNPLIWQIICLVISITIFCLILSNRSPNFIRPLSMAVRTGFGSIIPMTALVIYASFRIPGRAGELISLTFTMALFSLSLAGLWASGQTQSIVISGLIPVSDATNYYVDALRILSGMDISSFSANRPFFPGFLSLLLNLTNRNLMTTLGILTALAGLACYIASKEIQKTHGSAPATLFLMSMFLYFRIHSGTTMSESLGLTISMLGIAIIWEGANIRKSAIVLLGITVVTFALNIRPGAMFILPTLLLWGSWFFRGNKKISIRFIILGTMLVLAVFYINNFMLKFLAGPNSMAFSNFSWAFYGLASGGNSWTYIFQKFPELRAINKIDQTRIIYKLAIDLIIQDPSLIIKGAFQHWKMFFSSTWYNAYAFVAGDSFIINEVARWGMYFLCIFGIVKWATNRKDGYSSLVVITALGVLASVPFVPPTDAYRVRLYAATIPIFGLLPAMGVTYLRDKINLPFISKTPTDIQKISLTVPFSILLITVIMIAPIIIKISGKPPAFPGLSCPSNKTEIAIQYDRGTSVNITRENLSFLDRIPDFHSGIFRRNIHGLADNFLVRVLTDIAPPSTLFYTLDYQSNREVLVIIKTNELPQPNSIALLCGFWDPDPNVDKFRIFHADLVISK